MWHKLLLLSLMATSSVAWAAGIDSRAVKFDYQLPQKVQAICKKWDNCPDIDVSLIKTNHDWLTSRINRLITDDDNQQAHLKFRKNLDRFAHDAIKDTMQDNEFYVAWSKHIKPNYLGMHKQVAQFSIVNDNFLGGAHGYMTVEYVLFDMNLKSQIELFDILTQQGEEKIFDLVKAEFKKYRETLEKRRFTNAQIDELFDYGDLTDNVYFDKKGLVFAYQPYEIGSYAEGHIELVVPYARLKGLIDERYLP